MSDEYVPGDIANHKIAIARIDAVPLDGCVGCEEADGKFAVRAPGYPHPVTEDYA